MKIAVLHRYPISQVVGTNASFVSFLKELQRRGHTVFYLTYKESKGMPSRREQDLSFVRYCYLPFRFNRGNNKDKLIKTLLWLFLAPLYSLVLRWREGVDLFYADDSVPYYSLLTKLLVGRAKVVMRLGDLQSAYNFADCEGWKKVLYPLALSLEKLAWRTVDGVVAISPPFREFLLKQGIAGEKVAVVRESVDLDKFRPLPAPKTASPVVSFHGALLPQKGVDTLLKAFQLFYERYPSARLIIAGGGSSERSLRALAEELGISERVTFTGWYDHQKLISLVKDAHFSVVMRSANFGNNFVVTTCLLENWALGKPVIVPDLRAFRSVVKEEETGLFFPPGNAVKLFRKMDLLWSSAPLRRRLAREGRLQAKRLFDKNKIAQDMAEALASYGE